MNYLQHALDLLEDARHDDYSPVFQNAIRSIYLLVERADYLHLKIALSSLEQFPQIGNFRLDELICTLDSLLPENPPVSHSEWEYGDLRAIWECSHSETRLTVRAIKTGRRKAIQCTQCGSMLTIKFTVAQRQRGLYGLPDFDEDLRKSWNDWHGVFVSTYLRIYHQYSLQWQKLYPDKYKELLQGCRQAWWDELSADEQQAWKDRWQKHEEENQAWWDRYTDYLISHEWKEKRQQVLDRANGLCEQCGKPAGEVHHLSYKNVGNEPLSDLVALCYWCHHKAHGTTPTVQAP
jgi:hypothetical protein